MVDGLPLESSEFFFFIYSDGGAGRYDRRGPGHAGTDADKSLAPPAMSR